MNIQLGKIKVEIKNVYKGDYVPGEIVEDVVCIDFMQHAYGERSVLFFSGGWTDRGYDINSSIWNACI